MLEPSKPAMKSQKGFCWLRKRTEDMIAFMLDQWKCRKRGFVLDLGERDGSGW